MSPCLECVIMLAVVFTCVFGLDWYLAIRRWLTWKKR